MKKALPLWHRLNSEPPLYELACLVGYAGIPVPDAHEKLMALCEKYGKHVMIAASAEIVRVDQSTSPPTARLKDQVRALCFQLLGPAPESPAYERFYGTTAENAPPVPLQAKPVEEQIKGHQELARGMNSQELSHMLAMARMAYKNHSKRSFLGKQAKKEIAAAEAEMRRRGMDCPPERQDTNAQ